MNKLYTVRFNQTLDKEKFLQIYSTLSDASGFFYNTYSQGKLFSIGVANPSALTEKIEFKLALQGFRVMKFEVRGYEYSHNFWLYSKPII
jgi:hypothetical protein